MTCGRRRRRFGRLALAAAATIATPLWVEAVIHLAGDPRYAKIDEQLAQGAAYWGLAKAGFLTLDDRALRFRPTPGFRATIAGVDYRINALGLRGPEIAATKPAGTRRVLLLGDSYAFGLGLPEGEAIAAQLEQALNGDTTSASATRVEVVNSGVPAYQTEQERLLLERVGFGLEPEVVVLLYFANDKLPASLTWAPALNTLYHDELPVPYPWKPQLARSFLYAVVAKLDAARRNERGDYDSRGATHWPLTVQRIEAIAAACAARGVRFVLAAVPEMPSTRELLDPAHESAKDHAAVLALAAQNNWPCVDLCAGMLGKVKAFEKVWLSLNPIDTHYNAKGARFAAELIAPVVAAELAR
ncbi:MAG: hypothetical protein EXS13_04045 [Planctomycetes bacterium]|nr:hypothetical protein [Planctomycetota bacterium]